LSQKAPALPLIRQVELAVSFASPHERNVILKYYQIYKILCKAKSNKKQTVLYMTRMLDRWTKVLNRNCEDVNLDAVQHFVATGIFKL